jgi:hypothetical protein
MHQMLEESFNRICWLRFMELARRISLKGIKNKNIPPLTFQRMIWQASTSANTWELLCIIILLSWSTLAFLSISMENGSPDILIIQQKSSIMSKCKLHVVTMKATTNVGRRYRESV